MRTLHIAVKAKPIRKEQRIHVICNLVLLAVRQLLINANKRSRHQQPTQTHICRYTMRLQSNMLARKRCVESAASHKMFNIVPIRIDKQSSVKR